MTKDTFKAFIKFNNTNWTTLDKESAATELSLIAKDLH